MPDLDALAGELAEALMLQHARSVTPREALNDINDVADLTGDERDALLGMVLDRIEHADITIDLGG